MADNTELLIRIRADVRQALDELRQVRQGIGQVGPAGKVAASGLDSVSVAAQQTGNRLERLRSHASATTTAFRDLRRFVLVAFVAHEIIDFTRALVDANKQAQQIHFTLLSVTGSAAGARKEFDFVRKEADDLGLALASTAIGYSRLAASAYGADLSQQKLHKGFIGLAEALTVLHAPADSVNRILIQLDQAFSLGKVQMQDLRAISNALPSVFELVDEAFAHTGKSVKQMLAEGGIPAKEFFERFTTLLHDKYGPAAAEASHSLNSELNRLHNTIFGLETQPSGFVQEFTEGVRNLNATLNDPATQEGLKNLISGLGTIVNWLTKGAALVGNFGAGLGVVIAEGLGIPDANDQLAVTRHRLGEIGDELERLQSRAAHVQTQIDNSRDTQHKAIFAQSLQSIETKIAQLKHEQTLFEKAEQDLVNNGGTFGFVPSSQASQGGGNKPSKLPAIVNPATLRAQFEAQIDLVKEKLREQQAILDAQRQQDLIGLKDYYAQKARLQQRALDLEIAAKRKELAAEKNDTSKTAAEKQAKLIGEINVLEQKRAFIATQSAQAQAAAEKKVGDQIEQIRAKLLADQGRTAEAARVQIQQQYEKLLKRLELDSHTAGAQLVRNLINAEQTKAELQAVRSQYDRILGHFKAQQQLLKAQTNTGQISEADAQRQINQLYQQTSAELDPLLAKMQQLAAATGNQQTIDSVKQLRAQLKLTGEQAKHSFNDLNQFAVQAAHNVQDALAQAFQFNKLDDGLKGLVHNFADAMEQIAAQALALQLSKKLFGEGFATGKSTDLGGYAGTAAKFLASIFHDGGTVGTPAPMRSVSPLVFAGAPRLHAGLAPDEFPAILQRGEQVLSRDQVARGADGAQSIKVVLYDDRSKVADALSSPAGEKVIMQTVSRNADQIRHLIGV